MEQTDKERAVFAAKNLGLDFSSMPMKVMGGDVIEILDDEEVEAINKSVREEVLMKLLIKNKRCCRMRSKPLEGTNLGDWPEHKSLIGNMRTMSYM